MYRVWLGEGPGLWRRIRVEVAWSALRLSLIRAVGRRQRQYLRIKHSQDTILGRCQDSSAIGTPAAVSNRSAD